MKCFLLTQWRIVNKQAQEKGQIESKLSYSYLLSLLYLRLIIKKRKETSKDLVMINFKV
jgi:hypothetical protein